MELYLVFLVIAGFQLVAGLEDGERVNCIDAIIHEKHVIAPCVGDTRIEAPQERRDSDILLIGRLVSIIDSFIDDTIVKRRSSLALFGYALTLKNVLLEYKKVSDDFQARDVPPRRDPKFIYESLGMVKTIVSQSNYEYKQDTIKKDKDIKAGLLNKKHELYYKSAQDMKDFMHLLEAIVKESPTGLYIDFTNLTVDGEPMPSILTPFIKQFIVSGYGFAITLTEMIVGFAEKLNW